MAELYANTLGKPIAALAAEVSAGTTTLQVSVPAPEALQGGSFRIIVGSEVMLVTAGASSTSWTVTRNVESVAGGSGAVTHASGALVYHSFTAASPSTAVTSSQPNAVLPVIVAAAPSGDETGVADTANLETVAALLPPAGGTIQFRAGLYSLNNTVLGSLEALHGLQLRLVGVGAGATRLMPAGNGRILTCRGPGDSTSGYLSIADLTLGQAIGDTADYAYNEPLLQTVGYTNFRFERFTGRLNGTGTLLKLDSSFNGGFDQSSLITGRYGVPLEFDDSLGGTPQMDTVLVGNMTIQGAFGAIFRNITNGLNTLRFNGYKTYIPAGPDRETRAIGKLASEAVAGAGSVTLEAGQGASFAVGDPVFVGFGERADPNKVTEISGDKLTLRWPLRYAHNPAEGLGFQGQVLSHGVALSIASNTQLVKFDSCHMEGAATSILMDGAVNVIVDNCLGVYQDFIRVVGALQDMRIRGMHAQGSLSQGVNNIVTVPSANTSGVVRLTVDGPVTFTAGQPTPVLLNDPGSRMPGVVYELVELVSGVPRRTRNVPTASASSIDDRSMVQGVVRWSRDRSGLQALTTAAGKPAGSQYDFDAMGQAGILVPRSHVPWTATSLTAVANQAYVMRFKTSRIYELTLAAFRLITAAGSNDTLEIAIFSSAWERLYTTEAVAGKLNGGLGIVPVTIAFTTLPNTVYYAAWAFGAIGTTAAAVGAASFGSGVNTEFFGATAGKIEADGHATSAPLPNPFVGGAFPSTVPILALRES